MIAAQLVTKWQKSTLTEKSSAHSHFADICNVLGKPTPTDADTAGDNYTFEKGVTKTGGGKGFADVWMRGHFAWEYKGKGKSLKDAYDQILQYREDLENPPLLVVCDLNRFEIHTNFTGTAKRVYAFTLADLASPTATDTCPLPPLDVLRALFEDPTRLRPDVTAAHVTLQAARDFGTIAAGLRSRGIEPHAAARFLIRILFCLFAEDVGLLPAQLFSRLVENTVRQPKEFEKRLGALFGEMAQGGSFGVETIRHFNGGLFEDAATLEMTTADLAVLQKAARLDWASIEPSIFGTLFERGLDPDTRAKLGAHYTSREDILLIVGPVLMEPLRRRWAEVQEKAIPLIGKRDAAAGAQRTRLTGELSRLLRSFSEEVAAVRVLDPACGSGNFLYVALREMLDLEKEVITFATVHDIGGFFQRVGPEQMRGIELNAYAHELAPITVWIGYIQWLQDNGLGYPSEPILRRMDAIIQQDAVLTFDTAGKPIEPVWPEADVIIGNPPFLGGNRIRHEMGDQYVEALFSLYGGRVPAFADLVCYWFERARTLVESGAVRRVGLIATQGIRGGVNRQILEQIQKTGGIFFAHSDRNWYLDGAMVHVSMVGFDDGEETTRTLNGSPVEVINANLTSEIDLTKSMALVENSGICFMGPSPKGPFDVSGELAHNLLTEPINVNGRPNSDVVRPVASAVDLVGRSRGKWTIDFGVRSLQEAEQYERPFDHVKKSVYGVRKQNRRAAYAQKWWQYAEARPGMRKALSGLERFIATPAVAKHRIFVWVLSNVLCNQGTFVFARQDDYFFGMLQSSIHELWARGTGTQLREAESGFRYTPTSTFETFPFPWPPGQEPTGDPRVKVIADAALNLIEKRDAWLNPPNVSAAELAKRTLTALYNARPAWLDTLHKKLDAAVFAAYGWPATLTDGELLERLLALNLARSEAGGSATDAD